MPGGPNPSKVASANIRNETAISAVERGELLVGRVEKTLGNGYFRARHGVRDDATRQVSVSGVFRVGAASPFFLRPGDWVIYDGKGRGVVCAEGVITSKTPDSYRRLKRAGLIPSLPDLDGIGGMMSYTLDDVIEFVDDTPEEEAWSDPKATAKNLRQAADMAHAARRAAGLANAYKNRASGTAARIAARVAEPEFDPEREAELELLAERRAAQSAVDKARAMEVKRSAQPVDAVELRTCLGLEPVLPSAVENWEDM